MRRLIGYRALLLLASLSGCGSPELTNPDPPSFDTSRLEPGSTLMVVLINQSTIFFDVPQSVVVVGQPSPRDALTICGVTVSSASAIAAVPVLLHPNLAGVLFSTPMLSTQPIPAGTRIELTHVCGGGGVGLYRAVVLQGPQ
jgi:hypothetical protein